MRLLLLSCSERKSLVSQAVSAIDRYDGPAFQVVRKYLRSVPENDLAIWILSAEHGLITSQMPINNYDRRMTAERAVFLRAQVIDELRQLMQLKSFTEVFMVLGKTYQKTVMPLDSWAPGNTRVVQFAAGGAGKKLTELRDWLYGAEELSRSTARTIEQPMLFEERISGRATLRGVDLCLSHSEIEVFVERAINGGDSNYQRTKSWIAEIGSHRVSPKWLVSELTGVPVSEFAADEARRVLRQLGVAVSKVDDDL